MARGNGSSVGRFVVRFTIALVLFGALVGAVVVSVNSTIDSELARIPRVDVQTTPAPAGGANYLVVGSDSRAFVETDVEEAAFGDASSEPGKRSDTMMVVHVEPGAGATLVVSFPRDLWVDIPGIGTAKINAAYNSDLGGGPDAVIGAIRDNFGIDINHYVEVDFRTFESMVDAVGSVPVYIDRPMVDDFTGFVAVESGCYQLSGPEALAWVRSRHLESLNPATGKVEEDGRADIGRIERQQDFIRRLAGIVVEKSMSDPFKGRDIAHGVVDDLRVDQDFDKRAAFDLIEAFRGMSSSDTSSLEFATFPTTPGNRDGQSVLIPDQDAGRSLLDRLTSFDHSPEPVATDPSSVRVKVLNGSGRSGLADQTMAALVDAGFVKGGTGNDERGRVAVTEVRYASGAEGKAKLVLEHVGEGAKLVGDPSLDDADVVVVLGADFTGLAGSSAAADATDGGTGSGGGAPAAAPDAEAACR